MFFACLLGPHAKAGLAWLRRLCSAVGAARRLPCDARSRGPAAELAAFASLSALKHLRRVSSRFALRARPRALRFSAPLVRAASKPSPPLQPPCLVFHRRAQPSLRAAAVGWPPQRSKGGAVGRRPAAGDMSGGGHPADVAQGQRKHAEGSEKNFRNRREPNDRNGPKAEAPFRRLNATPAHRSLKASWLFSIGRSRKLSTERCPVRISTLPNMPGSTDSTLPPPRSVEPSACTMAR